jgi:hypothetical protein
MVCVQDPFEIKRNVANTLRMEMERPLLAEFRRAARITSYDSTTTGHGGADNSTARVEAVANEVGHGNSRGEGVLTQLLSRG